ncbi:MAG: hypothetical protein M3Y91_06170 [Actinomycetota bacterium]|nr:hypothetical protein [Actinomycetota bacterium]
MSGVPPDPASPQYLAREAGKWRQKQPPADFTKVGRFYGVWGRSVGFRPQTKVTRLDPAVAVEVEARLARWVTWKLAAARNGAPPTTRFEVRRSGDGVTAFGLGPDQAARILAWSQRAAARKQPRRSSDRGGGGAASVDLPALLASMDPLTGETANNDPANGPGSP